MGKSDEFPGLSNTNWLCDFGFAVDIFFHMNKLNVKLQGKVQFVHGMYTNVRAFKSKLTLFSRQISNKSFAHFLTLATPTLAMQVEATQNAKSTANHWKTCMENSAVSSLTLKKLASHFSWCPVLYHKTLKLHNLSCSWN